MKRDIFTLNNIKYRKKRKLNLYDFIARLLTGFPYFNRFSSVRAERDVK